MPAGDSSSLSVLLLLSLVFITGRYVSGAISESLYCCRHCKTFLTCPRAITPHNMTRLASRLSVMMECDFTDSLTVIHDSASEIYLSTLAEKLSMTNSGSYRYLAALSCNQLLQVEVFTANNLLLIINTTCLHLALYHVAAIDSNQTTGNYQRHTSRWLIVTSRSELSTIKSIMDKFDHVSVLVVETKKDTTSVADVFGSKMGYHDDALEHQLFTLMWRDQFRVWEELILTEDYGISQCAGTVFPNTRFGFNGRQFKATILPWPGFAEKRNVNGTVEYSGFCLDILKELAQQLNFTYVLVEAPDGEWGSLVEEWTGIVGQLIQQEADFSAVAISVDFARNQVIDFVSPSVFSDFKDIMYKTPEPSESRWRVLLDVYKLEVLVCLGIVTILCTCCLNLMDSSRQRPKRRELLTKFFNHLEQLWCSLLHHSSSLWPKSWSGRVIVSSWLLFAMVMSTMYTGYLMAFLAVPISKPPFTSLKEMLQNKEYKWGFAGGTSTQTSVSTSTDPQIQALWRTVVQFNRTDPRTMMQSVNTHLHRVMTEKYAYIVGHESFGQQVDCHVSFVGESIYQVEYSLALQNGSPLKKEFDRIMSGMWESGLLKQLSRKWVYRRNICPGPSTTSRQVVLFDVLGLFCVAGIGIGLAVIVLCIEGIYVIIQKCKRQKRK